MVCSFWGINWSQLKKVQAVTPSCSISKAAKATVKKSTTNALQYGLRTLVVESRSKETRVLREQLKLAKRDIVQKDAQLAQTTSHLEAARGLVRLQSNSGKQLHLANKQLEKLQEHVVRHVTALKVSLSTHCLTNSPFPSMQVHTHTCTQHHATPRKSTQQYAREWKSMQHTQQHTAAHNPQQHTTP
jgi:hypothetical protein